MKITRITPGFSCRHCGARSGHSSIKRKPRGDLDKQILKLLVLLAKSDTMYITKESLAVKLNVAAKYIEQSLHRMNIRGFISQPVHHAPHDSTRDPWGRGPDSAWQGDMYYLNLERLKKWQF